MVYAHCTKSTKFLLWQLRSCKIKDLQYRLYCLHAVAGIEREFMGCQEKRVTKSSTAEKIVLHRIQVSYQYTLNKKNKQKTNILLSSCWPQNDVVCICLMYFLRRWGRQEGAMPDDLSNTKTGLAGSPSSLIARDGSHCHDERDRACHPCRSRRWQVGEGVMRVQGWATPRVGKEAVAGDIGPD